MLVVLFFVLCLSILVEVKFILLTCIYFEKRGVVRVGEEGNVGKKTREGKRKRWKSWMEPRNWM